MASRFHSQASPPARRRHVIARTSHLAMARSGHRHALRQSEQPGARGARGSRGAGGQPQLGQDVRHMAMHGRGLITRRSAIWVSLRPCATSASTSRSRALSSSSRPASGSLTGTGGALMPRNAATARRTASPSPCHGRWASPGSVTSSARGRSAATSRAPLSRIARSCSRCTTSAGARTLGRSSRTSVS